MTSSSLLSWYSLNFAYVPFLALVCIHTNVLMMVCHPSLSGVSGRFIGTKGAAGGSGGGSSGGDGSSGTISFGTFLFCTFGIGV